MFKKTLLSFVLTLFLAVSAQAADNGFYFGLKFIDSIQSSGSVSTSGVVDWFDAGQYTQNTIGGGVFAGFDFFPSTKIPVRAELEYAIRTNAQNEWGLKDGALKQTLNAAGADINLKYQWNLQTLFLNGYYDFRNDSAFTPYVGAGLGLGFIDNKIEIETTGPGVNYSNSKSKLNTVFAWNVGAGVSYAITDNISADLAYRFVGLGYNEVYSANDLGLDTKVSTSPYANEFSLGVRFTF